MRGIPLLDLSGNEQLGDEKDSLVQTDQSAEMVRGTGFEPADSTLQQQPLTSQGTQGGTQIPSDPILARLVMAWPVLTEERKKIICILMDRLRSE